MTNVSDGRSELFNRLKARAVDVYDRSRDVDRTTAILNIVQALIDTREETTREVFGDVNAALDRADSNGTGAQP